MSTATLLAYDPALAGCRSEKDAESLDACCPFRASMDTSASFTSEEVQKAAVEEDL